MKKPYLLSLLTIIAVIAYSQTASAVAFSSDISISGSTSFDDSFSFGPTTGQMSTVEGGSTTSTALAGSTATGANPLSGTLTDIGDSFSFGGSGNASSVDEEFAMGIDSLITITNNSTSVFEIIFQLDFSNFVTSAGLDSYADSEFSVSRDGSEIFFTDLVSDTFYGNTIGGNATGDFGGDLLESGLFQIVLLLNPSDSTTLDSFWTLEGGNYDADGSAEFNSSFSFSVLSVTNKSTPPPNNIPAPGTLALIGISLFGFGFSHQRKTASA